MMIHIQQFQQFQQKNSILKNNRKKLKLIIKKYYHRIKILNKNRLIFKEYLQVIISEKFLCTIIQNKEN